MRFKWTFLAGAVLLGAFFIAAQIPAPNPALAQFSNSAGSPNDAISRLPAPPNSPAPTPRKTLHDWVTTPQIAPPKPTAKKPLSTPVSTPIPTLAPRFVGQSPLRVGLSTAGGPVAVWLPSGAVLFDLKQPSQTLSLPAGARFEVSFGAPQTLKRGAQTLRGPIMVSVAGAKFPAWQRVYIAVKNDAGGAPSEAARVSTNGANPKFGKPYRGDFEVFSQQLAEPVKRRGPLALVNILPLEMYLRGVVPWEMDADAPPEALRAQAICARTKTLDFKRTRRFLAGDFDVCDYDACQGYPGIENEKPATTAAVQSTSGLAIYQNNLPIDAVYSTNSGGITADANDAWPGGGEISYLQSVPDFAADSPLGKLWQGGMNEAKWTQFCAINFDSFASPNGVSGARFEAQNYRWKQFVSVETASKAFARAEIGEVTNLEVASRAASGRIRQLRVSGFDKPLPLAPTPNFAPVKPNKTLLIEGDGRIRAMFSGRLGSLGALPSSLFTVSPATDASGKLIGWNLQGAGWGHGVGMCQRGAQNHARAGWDARRILNFYYRGVEIR